MNADVEAMLKWCDEAADEFPYAGEIAAMLRQLAAQTGEPPAKYVAALRLVCRLGYVWEKGEWIPKECLR